MERIEVTGSSNVKSIGYDNNSQVLEVEFHNTRVYKYQAVPRAVFSAFLNSPGKGKFLNKNIIGKFAYSINNPEKEKKDNGE